MNFSIAVYAKRVDPPLHLSPYFGSMKLDAIGPREVDVYTAKKLCFLRAAAPEWRCSSRPRLRQVS